MANVQTLRNFQKSLLDDRVSTKKINHRAKEIKKEQKLSPKESRKIAKKELEAEIKKTEEYKSKIKEYKYHKKNISRIKPVIPPAIQKKLSTKGSEERKSFNEFQRKRLEVEKVIKFMDEITTTNMIYYHKYAHYPQKLFSTTFFSEYLKRTKMRSVKNICKLTLCILHKFKKDKKGKNKIYRQEYYLIKNRHNDKIKLKASKFKETILKNLTKNRYIIIPYIIKNDVGWGHYNIILIDSFNIDNVDTNGNIIDIFIYL